MLSQKPLPSVLIVDDNYDIHTVIQMFLESQGYKVRVAETVEKALIALEESPPDTILLDYRVPGMTPEGYIKIARSRESKPSIILMSAIDDLDQKAKALQCQFYLKKPFNIEDLPAIINERTVHTANRR